MRPIDIETWARSILETQLAGRQIEDQRVELKRNWPEPEKAARRLAGHANAAHGEGILWLIGVDEVEGLVAYPPIEISNWYYQLTARFDDRLAPHLAICLSIPFETNTVTALYFETDRAPYVVKVQDGKGIDREIPWRVGNSTRTAKRSEVLSLLAPIQRLPEVDVQVAEVIIRAEHNDKPHDGPKCGELRLTAELYVAPTPNSQIVIPYYKCWAQLTAGSGKIMIPIRRIVLSRRNRHRGYTSVGVSAERQPTLISEGITTDGDQAIMRQPGQMDLHGWATDLTNEAYMTADAVLQVHLHVLWSERPLTVNMQLERVPPGEDVWGHWKVAQI